MHNFIPLFSLNPKITIHHNLQAPKAPPPPPDTRESGNAEIKQK